MNKERKFYTLENVSKKQMVQIFDISLQEAGLVMKYRKKLPVLFDEVDSEETHSVNLRELHKQLEVKDHFSDWIKRKSERLQVIDLIGTDLSGQIKSIGYDADVLKETQLTAYGQVDRIEYHAKPDAAKMICMQENNEVGDLVRRYFLLCEKLLHRIATRNPTRVSCIDASNAIFKTLAERNTTNPVKIKSALERNVCLVATGAVPKAWRDVLGVKNVRDYLKHHGDRKELQRYEEVLRSCDFLTKDPTVGSVKLVAEQLKRVFGESNIYDKYLSIEGAYCHISADGLAFIDESEVRKNGSKK